MLSVTLHIDHMRLLTIDAVHKQSAARSCLAKPDHILSWRLLTAFALGVHLLFGSVIVCTIAASLRMLHRITKVPEPDFCHCCAIQHHAHFNK